MWFFRKKVQHWDSPFLFFLATLGSAVGLGTVWRLPFLVGMYGGLPFLLAYITCLFFLGLPFLYLETSLGQRTQKAAPLAFAQLTHCPQMSMVGWWALLGSFFVLSYYVVLIAFLFCYAVFSTTLAWGQNTSVFFTETFLPMDRAFHFGPFLAFLLVWIGIYFGVWKGIESIGKVVRILAPLPFLFLCFLLLFLLPFPGVKEGIGYIFAGDWTQLLSFELWVYALSMSFFSLSLASGVMISYGSLKKKKEALFLPLLFVVIGVMIAGILATLVVFGTLGFLSAEKGVSFSSLIASSGPGLLFVTIPQAFHLFGPLGPVLGVSFFLVLTLMGISASLAILEAFSLALEPYFPKLSKPRLFFFLSCIGGVLGTTYLSFAAMERIFFMDRVLSLMSLLLVGVVSGILFWRSLLSGVFARVYFGVVLLLLFLVWGLGLYTFFSHAGIASFFSHGILLVLLICSAFGMTLLEKKRRR